MEGWIKLYRQILDHPLWKSDPYDKAHAWIDLLMRVDYESGQMITTISELSKRWGWSWHKTERFINDLKKEEMIRATNITANERQTSRQMQIYIIKWKVYQEKNTPRQSPRQSDGKSDGKTNANLPFNNIKNIKKEGEETRSRAKAPGKGDIFKGLKEKYENEENDDN